MKWLIKKRDGKIETDGEAIVRLMEEKYRMYYQYMNAEIHNNFILLRKLMNQNTKEPWEREFDNKFKSVWNSQHSEFVRIPEGIKENMRSFIRSLLLSQKNELVGDARKLVKDDDHDDQICDPPFDGCGCAIDDYNQGVSDVIDLINKKP